MNFKLLFNACISLLIFSTSLLLSQQAFASNDPTTSWSSVNNLPNKTASAVSTSINGKLYLFGGANSIDFSQVYTSTSSANGQISNWESVSPFLPQTRYWGAFANKGDTIYIIGGASLNSPGIFVNTVYSSRLQSNGTISPWQSFTPLPNKLGMGAAAVVGNRVYYAGGFNSSGVSKKVYSAPINTDGSLGQWIESGEMPESRQGLSMLSYNGYIIIIGGYNGSYLSTVYKTTPGSDGKITSWKATTSFPYPVYRTSAVIVGDKIVAAGSALVQICCNALSSQKVFYADIDSEGNVGEWVLSENLLPSPLHAAGIARVGDYLYLIGGYNNWSNQYLDSVYVTKLNLEIDLNVPLIKQTDAQWGSKIYDTANKWAPAGEQGIFQWGCALTSAVMVFQYHEITKLPDGTLLTPRTLNEWLKSQSDGYVNSGWVNWIALSRLSKIAKSKNPEFSYDGLEYKRISGFDSTSLTNDLKNNIPNILEEPKHFIVAKGTKTSTFKINDPFYERYELSSYSNTALSMGRYIPSHTDLSYMMFVVDDGVKITVRDKNGEVVGEGFSQQPLDEDGGTGKSGVAKYFYYVPKPADNAYSVILSSDAVRQYTLESFLYDRNGEVNMDSKAGIIGDFKDSFTISFNNIDSKKSKITPDYSFDSLISDLDLLYSKGLITNLGVYKSMKEHVLQAKKNASTNKKLASSVIGSFQTILETNRKKTVKEEAYQIIKPQVVYLLNSLK